MLLFFLHLLVTLKLLLYLNCFAWCYEWVWDWKPFSEILLVILWYLGSMCLGWCGNSIFYKFQRKVHMSLQNGCSICHPHWYCAKFEFLSLVSSTVFVSEQKLCSQVCVDCAFDMHFLVLKPSTFYVLDTLFAFFEKICIQVFCPF